MILAPLLLGALALQAPPDTAAPQPLTPAPAVDFRPARIAATNRLGAHLAAGVGPGFSVAVGYDDQVVWAQGFGFADLETERPVTPDTLFRIGSVSKPLTAAGLMKLVEAGKLDLDAEVQEYVPDFPRKKWPITSRQLGGHLAGIRHYKGGEFLSRKHYSTVTEGLAIFQNDPLLHEPGTRYAYSSYGWNLLSAVMEGASGTPFLIYMKDEVFTPLGLAHTMADQAQERIPARTRFYAKVVGKVVPAPIVDNSYKWAGGGFLSTPSDLVRFGQAHLKPGFLNKESLHTLFTPQHTRDGRSTSYGIGWSSGKVEAIGRFHGHSGGSVGGVTQLFLFPDLDLVVAATLNNSEGPVRTLALDTARAFAKAITKAGQSG